MNNGYHMKKLNWRYILQENGKRRQIMENEKKDITGMNESEGEREKRSLYVR